MSAGRGCGGVWTASPPASCGTCSGCSRCEKLAGGAGLSQVGRVAFRYSSYIPRPCPPLQRAKDDGRPVPWVLLENVSGAGAGAGRGATRGMLASAAAAAAAAARQILPPPLPPFGWLSAATAPLPPCPLPPASPRLSVWLAWPQVEALLDRHGGEPPVMQYCCQQLMRRGYGSWAYRVVNSAGGCVRLLGLALMLGTEGDELGGVPPVGGTEGIGPAACRRPRLASATAGHTPRCTPPPLACAGFGVPNRRRRVFLVASMHGDARDVLLSQVLLLRGQRCLLAGPCVQTTSLTLCLALCRLFHTRGSTDPLTCLCSPWYGCRASSGAPAAASRSLKGAAATAATPTSCATCGTTAACPTPATWATPCERVVVVGRWWAGRQ